jgi:hypothetical protein
MERVMKETGKWINNMVLEKKYGQMALLMKVISNMERSMVKANSLGQMAQSSWESALIITSMAEVFIAG